MEKIEYIKITYCILHFIRTNMPIEDTDDPDDADDDYYPNMDDDFIHLPARVSVSDILSDITSRLSICLKPDDLVDIINSMIRGYPSLGLSFENKIELKNNNTSESKTDWIVTNNDDYDKLSDVMFEIEFEEIDDREYIQLHYVYNGIMEDYIKAKIEEQECLNDCIEKQLIKQNQKDEDEDDSIFIRNSEREDDDDIDPLEIRKDAWGNFSTRGGQMWEKAHRRSDDV